MARNVSVNYKAKTVAGQQEKEVKARPTGQVPNVGGGSSLSEVQESTFPRDTDRRPQNSGTEAEVE